MLSLADLPEAEAAIRLRQEFDLRLQVQSQNKWLQDLWFLTYKLVDKTQDDYPSNRPRYYTSRASSIVDTGRRVLARNPVRYRVVAPMLQRQRDERERWRVLENALHGVLYDIDRQMTRRGEMKARMVAAFHMLMRGQWAYKLHLTSQAKTSTGSPLHYEQLDPRLVLPTWDIQGCVDPIRFDATNLATLLAEAPPEVREHVDGIVRAVKTFGSSLPYVADNSWLYMPLTMIEYSTREEHGVLVDIDGLPEDVLEKLGATRHVADSERRYMWFTPPTRHGFGVSTIQAGNVNSAPVGTASTQLASELNQFQGNLMPVDRGTGQTRGEYVNGFLQSPSGFWVPQAHVHSTIDTSATKMGRSIFASINHLFPEYNRALALMKQGVENEIRGTWVFKSRQGQLVSLELGSGTINPLSLTESLERVQGNIRPIDSLTMLQMINEDISQGSLDLRFLLASDFDGSGFLRKRLEEAAHTPLTDYQHGMEDWSLSVADTFMAQYRAGHRSLKNWKLVGRQPGMETETFVLDIDEQVKDLLTDGTEPPIIEARIKVALPIDMASRINMAKSAIDPNNPVMGLTQAIDLILDLDDADAAYDMIMEDIAFRNPSIQLMKIADAMRRAGAEELAQMILADQFRTAFGNEVQTQRGTSPNGQAVGTDAATSPPEAQGAGRAPVGGE